MSDLDRAPNRRSLLATSAAAAVVPALPAFGAAPGPLPLGDASRLVERTLAWLGSLDPNQKAAASFPWAGDQWRSWSYFGVGGFSKPGLRLEQMLAPQKDAAWAMLAEVLSPAGVEKARTNMLLQDILIVQGNGRGARSSERYSVSVFGAPGMTGTWGIRLEGHHLTHSFTIRDGRLVSVTPAAFAALPNRVTSGRHAGLVALKTEEIVARQLLADLAPKLKGRAVVRDEHLFNILSSSGRERANAARVGIAAAEMTDGQRDLLWQVVDAFAVDPYSGAIATAQAARVRAGDRAAVHFAWYGPNTPERSFGYRIIGDTFVIELGCIDGAAQHIHPVYHDLETTLGGSA